MSERGNKEIGIAILQAIEHQTLPDSDTIAASTFNAEDVKDALHGIQIARSSVEAEIRTLSEGAAADVDGWIAQAKKLQVDIETSRDTAREIVEQAEAVALLREQYNDAARKADLLQLEVEFTGNLQRTLRKYQKMTRVLQEAQDAVVEGKYIVALDKLESIEHSMPRDNGQDNTNAIAVIRQRASKVKQDLMENVADLWHTSFLFDKSVLQFSVSEPRINGSSLEDLLEISARLDLLESKMSWLAGNLDACIFRPLLASKADMKVGDVFIESRVLRIRGTKPTPSADVMMNETLKVIHFLNDNLPPQICMRLSETSMAHVIAHMLTHWFPTYIPVDVSRVAEFESLLHDVASFASRLTALSWQGATELNEWIEQGPKLWLSKRREVSLSDVRRALSGKIGNTQTVERVETQVISPGEAMVSITKSGADGNHDDWNNDWQDESHDNASETAKEDVREDQEEADASAWGFEDGEDGENEAKGEKGDTNLHLVEQNMGDEKQDEDAAWGWDEEETQGPTTTDTNITTEQPKLNGNSTTPPEQERRELTLRELYTITEVPDELHRMIKQVIQDAKTLRLDTYESCAIAPVASALFSLPTLILAGYRALASSYYLPLTGGNMYLYNDCVRLAIVLSATAKEQREEEASSDLPKSSWPSTRLKLDADVTALESFGKRAYGREMESQRTILRDLLDGTQGFSNCSEAPFTSECQNAITTTVERVLEVGSQWRGILSRSALLQSLGSLISTVIGKIIVDIEDLADISESESQQLRKYCDSIGRLSDMFREENQADPGQKSDMIGVYVPNWFKFQYLSEIMDSSLADIRHFWTEGGLRLEFEAEEIVDLIQALFAESDHRRKAIAEIRRT